VSRPASDDNARRTRAEQNADSGRRLLKALVDLMAEKGYNDTSAAEIGVRAGFSRAMVHARFGTKDALLDELLRAEWEQRFLGGVVDGLTGLQRVLAYADQLGQLADDDERFLRAMFVLSFEAARGSAVMTPRIVRFLEELEAGVADAVTVGQTDGSVAPMCNHLMLHANA
jgi:AcrR family transcriptional regulator